MGYQVIGLTTAGAWGGSFVGVIEAIAIVAFGATLAEFGLFPFAFWAYGALGFVLGLLIALVRLVFAPGTRISDRAWTALAAGLVVLPLALVVARYHVAQRYFAEQFPSPLSGMGLLVYLALLLGAILVSVIVAALVFFVAGGSRQAVWRLPVCWVLAFLALKAGAAGFTVPQPPPLRLAHGGAGQPNIVLVVVDTLRADALGIAGGTSATPHMDALARDGVWFRNAYAQSSWTRPSIATILTGQYSPLHGAVHKFDPLPDEVRTVAEILRDAGYWTAAFVTNINVAPIFNFQQGFGEYHYLPPAFYFGASDSATRLSAYKLLRMLRERFLRRRLYYHHYYQDARVVTERVSQWLAEAPPRPFFLFVHYMDPHDPYFEIPYNGRGIARVVEPSPPPDRAEEMRRLYAQDVQYFDGYFGALMEEFRRRELYDDTVFILTADHGEEFYEHGGWWHGTTLYEEQIRVPLIVRLPGGRERGIERTDLAQTLDILPTILGQAGVALNEALPGRDLFSASAPPEVLYAHESLEGNELEAVRWQDWKLVVANAENPRGLPTTALFDLSRDPEEKVNLADSRPELVREMLGRLERIRPGTGGMVFQSLD
ncbi:Arylsulfatase [bacterium HR30]|nr:Arylsulfatase [bacterium HR30]